MNLTVKREWVVVVGAFVLAIPLWLWRGTYHRRGTAVDARITLITSDREDLACGLDQGFEGHRCAFRADGQATTGALASKNTLAPYFTLDRQMFLIPALFEQAELAARYSRESPASIPRDQLKRFVARCQLRLVAKVDTLKVRWERTGQWGDGANAWVAEPSECHVQDE